MRALTAVLLGLLLIPPIRADDSGEPDTQIGNARFKMPNGWRRAGNQAKLIPPGVPAGKSATLSFLPGEELKTDLRQWFDATWEDVSKKFKRLEDSGVEALRIRDKYDALVIVARLDTRNGKQAWVVLLAAQAGERVESLLFVADDAEVVRQSLPAIDDLVSSLSFEEPLGRGSGRAAAKAREQAPPAPPVPDDGRGRPGAAARKPIQPPATDVDAKPLNTLDGFYYLPKRSLSPTYGFGGVVLQAKDDYYCITLNRQGQSQWSVVRGTGSHIPKGEATYRIDGDRIHFSWPNGRSTTGQLSADRQQLEVNGEVYKAGRTQP